MSAQRRVSRVWRDIALAFLSLLLLAILGLWLLVRASLPQIEGEVSGLGVTARIERDSLGTPTIQAASRSELAFATGFAHAQDRFFQMDLLRRAAAGEMAELLGPGVVDRDREFRVHGFRHVAQQVMAQLRDTDRALLESYAEGVNAGLNRLTARPWEYLILGAAPRAWTMEDSLLCGFAMYLTLNDPTGRSELARARLQESLPPAVFGFLFPVGTEWDAPLSGGTWRAPAIPDPTILDLRGTRASAVISSRAPAEPHFSGSNVWAVDAAHSANGAALLANDMHLGLRLPHVWYRARLIVTSPADALDLVGVTLPGSPALVVGSNRHVAWGFSNSYGDWTDLVAVDVDPADRGRYLIGGGSEPFTKRVETIRVRGGESVHLEITATRWGPIVMNDSNGRPLALAWTAHHPHATNLRLLDLERATTVDEALDVANRAGLPVQNFVVADSTGRIGWSLMGQVPVRSNYDPNVPASWRNSDTGWTAWQSPDAYPRIVDPPSGRLWVANARPIDAPTWLQFAGSGNYDTGARAGQIRDGLLALPSATVSDMVALQLDDRALFLTRWRDLLLQLLEHADVSAGDRQAARAAVQNWSGRASMDDAGYTIVRAFRLQVRADVFAWLIAPKQAEFPDLALDPSPQFEGSLWQLVTQKPVHLLDPRHGSWDEALLDSLDRALAGLRKKCGDVAQCTWGSQNTLQMTHPLSAAIPMLAAWLDMPQQPLSGDAAMPRVQGPKFGASERLVVSPGREEEGVLQLPGGPVDHPMSRFYGAGHDAWVRGEPTPLLPGKTEHVLRLMP